MSLDVGQVYTATLDVLDGNEMPATPATYTLSVTLPGKARTVVPLTPTAPSEGHLTCDYLLSVPGLHKFAWVTTGPGTAQTDYINARNFVSLVSLAEAKAHLGVIDTRKDQIIRLLMGVATRHVERICGTCVIRDFSGVFVAGSDCDVMRLIGGPLVDDQSVTQIQSVMTGGPLWADPSLFIVNADAATVRLQSYAQFWGGPWRADFTAGRTEIPETLVHGAKEIIWDLWAEYRGLTSDTDMPDLQDVAQFENTIAQMAVSGYKLLPRALQHLEGERRPGFA